MSLCASDEISLSIHVHRQPSSCIYLNAAAVGSVGMVHARRWLGLGFSTTDTHPSRGFNLAMHARCYTISRKAAAGLLAAELRHLNDGIPHCPSSLGLDVTSAMS